MAEAKIPDELVDTMLHRFTDAIPPAQAASAMALGAIALEFCHSQPGILAALLSWNARQDEPYPVEITQRHLELADLLLTMLADKNAKEALSPPEGSGDGG